MVNRCGYRFSCGRRGVAAAAVAVGLAAGLAGCSSGNGPVDGRGPVPDPERDGCAPYAWYTAGDVPVRMAAAWTGGLVEGIAVQDGLAVVASRSCGLRLLDVSDPAAPRLLGTGSVLPAVAVDLLDGLAAVAEGDRGFSLHDVSTPAAPVLLSRVAVSGAVGGSRYTDAVLLQGTRLFVAGFHRQLVCYDVSDPRAPVEKGRMLLDRPGALALVGDRLFAGGRAVARVGQGGGLSLVQELGRGAAEDLEVVGDRVHAAVTDGLATFDISSPDTVLLVDLRPLSRARSLAAAGDLLYVGVAPPGARLKAWDFAGGGEPALVVDADAAFMTSFSSLVRVGGTLLVGDRWLRTIDIADPLQPDFAAPAAEPAYPQGLAVCGDHAVVVDGPLAAVYALGDGPAVTPAASYYLGQSILYLTAGGRGTVYLARNAGGLVVLQPASGIEPELVHPADWFGSLAASDSLLVTGAGGTLRVYGLTNPARPTYLGELDFGDYVRKVSVAGSRALVSLAAAQLVLVDLSDPTRPLEVARDPDNVVFRSSGAVAWADSFGLDYHTDGLLRIVQPGAGGHLETVGAVASLGEGRSLALQGQALYTLSGEGWGGASYLDVLDLSDPRRLVAAGRARRPDESLTHLVRDGDYLYALTSGGIIRFWPDCGAVE